MKYIFMLGVILQISLRWCAPQEDLVDLKLLQELPQNYAHKWYAGYLQASLPGDSIYYHFFESQNDPAKDPIVLWLQGGPGCSGLFGSFYENGPFQFYPSSTKSYLSEYAWNKNANVLYIESPAGVGFSHSQKQVASDNSSAADNLAAVLDFLAKYPEYSHNELVISGESYGGIYIPYLATAILDHNAHTTGLKVNLKGIILGNACTLGGECTDSALQPLYYSIYEFYQFNDHGFFSFEDWAEFKDVCDDNHIVKYVTKECLVVQRKLTDSISYDYLDLDNLNGICYHIPEKYASQVSKQHYKFNNKRHTLKNKKKEQTPCNYELGDAVFLNQDSVRAALHVKQTVKEFQWGTCTDDEIFTYTETPIGSYHLYPNLIANKLKIWVYSGDVDANVPITGTLAWISLLRESLNLRVNEAWRAWYIPGNRDKELQVGGMCWDLEGIQFVSIRGAGHEVPFWKPQNAFVMIQHYLNDTPLPYNPVKSLNLKEDHVLKHFKMKLHHKE